MDLWVVKYASRRSRIGDFFGRFIGPRRPDAGRFGLRRVQGKGGCRLRELNRNYRDVVLLGGTG